MALLKIGIAKKENGIVIVALDGHIDTDTHIDLMKKLEPILKTPVKMMVFDMKGVTYVSSMGINVIFMTREKIEKAGGHLLLVNLQPQIVKLFDILKTLLSKDVFKTVAELDAYLASIQKADA
jgi:anti-sigma B factor antagonist